MGRLSSIPDIEKRIGKPLKEYLKESIESGKKPAEIATEIGISQSQAYQFIKDCGLKEVIKAARKWARSTIGDLKAKLEEYFEEKTRAGLSPISIQKDREAWRLYLWWLDSTRRIADVEPHGLSLDYFNDFFTYLSTQTNRYGKNFKRPLSKVSQQTYRKRMAAFINWLVKMEFVSKEFKNPFNKMMKIKLDKKLPEDMPDEIIELALNSFGGDLEGIRNKTIYAWFLETGMRLGGITSIKMNQFDWKMGRGRITEKGNKERTIWLSDKLKAQVTKYLVIRESKAKCDSLWIAGDGEALTDSGIYTMIASLNDTFKDDIARLCPGQRFHPHLFRHIWAKHLAQSEVPGFAMMVMGGWEDLELVRHYALAYNQDKAWSYINKASPLSKIGGIEENGTQINNI